MTEANDPQIDPEIAELLAECQRVGPSEIIHDDSASFEPTSDARF